MLNQTPAQNLTGYFWWIETIRIKPGQYYRYHITGRNELSRDPAWAEFSWSVPNLHGGGGRFAFRLREVKWTQPEYHDCPNCGTVDHHDYRCPCACHDKAAA